MKREIKVILASFIIIVVMFYFAQDNEIMLETKEVRQTNVVNSIMASGFIEQEDKNLISIDTNGIVTSLAFRVGDEVLKGDTIMTIEKAQDISYVSAFSIDQNLIGKSDLLKTSSDIITIKSNVDGTIMSIPSEIGASVITAVPFLSIALDEEYIAKISVAERYINDIEIGQKVNITSEAFDGIIYGEISSISPFAKKELDILGTGSEVLIDATVRLYDSETKIIPGISVLAKISINERENALVVPYTAVFQEEKNEFVYVLEGDTIEKREISTGYALDSDIEVTSGLEIDDIVVLNKDINGGETVYYE